MHELPTSLKRVHMASIKGMCSTREIDDDMDDDEESAE